MTHCLEYQAYMELTCYQCEKWPECQSSNIEDWMRRDKEELELLRLIDQGKVADDANLVGARQKAAQNLFKCGYINACFIEGSDAPVEALWITDKGKAVLARRKGRSFHE